ncbi:MAG: YfiM family protein [Bacteroidia bacterium]|nr:YfiM family protein [Bacteroidia bacterium]
MRSFFIICFVLLLPFFYVADTLKLRKTLAFSATAGMGIGSLLWLQKVWYAPYHNEKFHFFDDAGEWLQMDKAGHVFTAYQASRILGNYYENSGIKHPFLWSSGITLGYLTAIEVMDGFSSGWGFSKTDFWCNILGTIPATLTEYEFLKGVKFKFSYVPHSKLYRQKPALLGSNFAERVLKDYNNQAYWFSIPFFPGNGIHKVICISLGYGADGMLSGHPVAGDGRARNFYLSFDINPNALPIRKKIWKKLFGVFNVLKLPFPAVGINKNGMFFTIR